MLPSVVIPRFNSRGGFGPTIRFTCFFIVAQFFSTQRSLPEARNHSSGAPQEARDEASPSHSATLRDRRIAVNKRFHKRLQMRVMGLNQAVKLEYRRLQWSTEFEIRVSVSFTTRIIELESCSRAQQPRNAKRLDS